MPVLILSMLLRVRRLLRSFILILIIRGRVRLLRVIRMPMRMVTSFCRRLRVVFRILMRVIRLLL